MMIRHGDPHHPRCAGRLKGLVAIERLTGQFQNVANDRLELLGTRGRLDPARMAQEQFVVEYLAKAAQRMADGGLREAEPFRHSGELAMAHQFPEHHEQRHVEAADIDFIHIGYR